LAIQRLPEPPRNVQRRGRVLTWDPPEHAREIAGYAIYRGGELLSRELTVACRCEMPDEQDKYTVVSVEHSGLQSPSPDRQPPSSPRDLSAAARSPFAVALNWTRSPAIDVRYYNVYCSAKSQPDAVQENRIASPTEPHLLDWGLQAGTQYHYVVTAVDASGNESPACTDVAVQTPAIDRVQQRIPIGKELGNAALTVSLDMPRKDRYLLWIELKAGHLSANQLIQVSVDGGRPILSKPTWEYVTTGWGTPVATPFFDTLKSDGRIDPWFELPAGAHRLEVTLPGGTAELASLTVTNDAGYLPDGITSFRHPAAP
jgi:hypothetical protein